MKLNTCLIQLQKIWDKNLNVKLNLKFLEENIEKNSLTLVLTTLFWI